jgi:O-antigen ligase
MPAGWAENQAVDSTNISSPKSDLPVYVLAIVLGAGAGVLEIKVGDLLATALFVLVSTLFLGFLRPRNAWRWIVVVGFFVPLARLLALVFMNQRPYHAQIWTSGLGFVTGIAGSYAGAMLRLAVDELFRSR